MEKFENLTLEQLNAKEAEFAQSGIREAQTIVSVEPGKLEGSPVIITIGRGKDSRKTVSFFAIQYERKGEKRYFKGANFDAKHLSSGKQYSNLTVGINDDDKERLSNPANLAKSYILSAESYTTSDNRKVTTVKMAE